MYQRKTDQKIQDEEQSTAYLLSVSCFEAGCQESLTSNQVCPMAPQVASVTQATQNHPIDTQNPLTKWTVSVCIMAYNSTAPFVAILKKRQDWNLGNSLGYMRS